MEEFIELTKDRGLFKKILREGSGLIPSENAKLLVNYKINLEDGKLIEERNNEYFDFKDSHLLGLNIGIRTMKKNEKAIFVMRYDYGYVDEISNYSNSYQSFISCVDLVDIK